MRPSWASFGAFRRECYSESDLSPVAEPTWFGAVHGATERSRRTAALWWSTDAATGSGSGSATGAGHDGSAVAFGSMTGIGAASDVDASAAGTLDQQRLYQLIRQGGPIRERLFEIEFLEPGADVYCFTFG